MITIREERMSDGFVKYHIEGLPFPLVLHQFTQPDNGDPHDHPWSFQTHILKGGYVEEVFSIHDGESYFEERRPGTSHHVSPSHIHRIPRLLADECWTIILPEEPHDRTPGFYRFDQGRAFHRFWHEQDFKPIGESQ